MNENNSESLMSLSPLDGRYCDKTAELRNYFSESALIKYRMIIEINWLISLAKEKKIEALLLFSTKGEDYLRRVLEQFSIRDAQEIKDIEKETNHDVKSIEYFIQKKLKGTNLESAIPFIHFCCTSEDINNLSYALMVKDSLNKVIIPELSEISSKLKSLAKEYIDQPMMARTHGQPASPTTMGKEMANFVYRLDQEIDILKEIKIYGKMNGAVGNFNAHVVAYPEVDWQALAENFIKSLGLDMNPMTTQIEPHNWNARIFDALRRINNVLIDLSRDMWMYISISYFKQKKKATEVGSSTMPHKVNPIDFENGEGNLGVANALLSHLSEKLLISRWQRDLSDSTVQRNIGSAFGYSLLAYKSIMKGLSKLIINKEAIDKDLEENYALLSEAIQTIMRKCNVPDAYEQLKELTRGKEITKEAIAEFVKKLNIPKPEKDKLLKLTPATYIGLAKELVKKHC